MIAGFHREVYEIGFLLGYYAASSDNFLPTFRDNLSVPSSKGRDNLSVPSSSVKTTPCVIAQRAVRETKLHCIP